MQHPTAAAGEPEERRTPSLAPYRGGIRGNGLTRGHDRHSKDMDKIGRLTLDQSRLVYVMMGE